MNVTEGFAVHNLLVYTEYVYTRIRVSLNLKLFLNAHLNYFFVKCALLLLVIIEILFFMTLVVKS